MATTDKNIAVHQNDRTLLTILAVIRTYYTSIWENLSHFIFFLSIFSYRSDSYISFDAHLKISCKVKKYLHLDADFRQFKVIKNVLVWTHLRDLNPLRQQKNVFWCENHRWGYGSFVHKAIFCILYFVCKELDKIKKGIRENIQTHCDSVGNHHPLEPIHQGRSLSFTCNKTLLSDSESSRAKTKTRVKKVAVPFQANKTRFYLDVLG